MTRRPNRRVSTGFCLSDYSLFGLKLRPPDLHILGTLLSEHFSSS